jgi:hypothetical protein
LAGDHVLLAQTRFQIDGAPVNWILLLVPDAATMTSLPQLLTK